MVERMGWVGGRRGARRGIRVVVGGGGVVGEGRVWEGEVGVVFVFLRRLVAVLSLLLLLRESLWLVDIGGAGSGSTLAPAHASRRCMYVRNPSFHFISSSSISCRLRFRESIGWAKSSGVSKR